VLVHLEAIPGQPRLAWWAESPDVTGFSALDEDLPALMVRTEIVLRDLLGSRPFEVHYELVADAASADNPAPDAVFVPAGAADPLPAPNPGQEVAITARPLVPAA
jgi:hypothetical protein